MNILIVGLGSIARKHIIAIKQLEINFKIYALRSKKAKDEKYITNIYNLNDINDQLDFIIISNPTAFHEKTINKLIYLKVPLFIEKPVLNDFKNAIKISKNLKTNKIPSYVACNMRFHPSINFLKKFIDEFNPIINEVNVYSGSYLPDWRKNKNYKNSYSSQSKMGGGVHLDLIHEIDYCKWIFGFPLMVKSLKRSVSSLEIDSIDFSNYNLIYNNYSINIILNYYRKHPKREIELVIKDETIIVDLLKNSVYSNKEKRFLFKKKFNIQETYNKQMKYFVENINRNLMNCFDEGIETLKIALNE